MLQNNPQVAQIRKALTGRVLSELESLAEKDAEAFGKIWEAFGRVLKEGHLRGLRAARAAARRWRASTPRPAQAALAQAIRRRPQAEPDRDLLPGRRQRRAAEVQSQARSGARARHRGAAADRSGRRVLDLDAAGLRGQAAEVAEPGRGRFRPGPAARREAKDEQAESKSTKTDDEPRDRRGEGALGERVSDVRASQRLTDSPACLVARRRARPRDRAAAGARRTAAPAPSRSSSSTCGIALVKAVAQAKTDGRDDDVADLADPAVRAGADPRRRGAGRSGGVRGAAEPAGGARPGRKRVGRANGVKTTAILRAKRAAVCPPSRVAAGNGAQHFTTTEIGAGAVARPTLQRGCERPPYPLIRSTVAPQAPSLSSSRSKPRSR